MLTRDILGATNTWQYEYLPDSELLLSVSNAPSEVMTVRNYEANRNLLTNIHHRVGTVALSGFAYANDALGRRIGRGDHRYYGMGMPDDVGNSFAYNARSELTNAVMGERNYGWSFDNIGNRQTYSTNGTTLNYLANELNQYTDIPISEQQKLNAALAKAQRLWSIGHCPLAAAASWLFDQPVSEASDFAVDDLEGLCTIILRQNNRAGGRFLPLKNIKGTVYPVGEFHRQVLEEALRRLGRGVVARRAKVGDWNDVCYSYQATVKESSVAIPDASKLKPWQVVDVTTEARLAGITGPPSPGTCEAPANQFDIRRMKYRLVFDMDGKPVDGSAAGDLSQWISVEACDAGSTEYAPCEHLSDFALVGVEAEACFPDEGDAHGDNEEVTAARLRDLGIKKRGMPEPLWGDPLQAKR